MTVLTRRAALGGGLALVSACASMRDPAPGVFRVGSGLSVTLGRVWSDFTPSSARKMHLLSLNGLTLDRLYLAAGLSPGEGLTAKPRASAQAFHAGMSPDELVAFIADSVDSLGYARPDISDVQPAKLGAADGLCMTIATRTGDGLEFTGLALVAERAGKLNVILYLAAREHYFAAALPDVEAIMASAVLR